MNDLKSAFFSCLPAEKGGGYQRLLSARAATSSSSHTESLFFMDLVRVAMKATALKAHLENHCLSF